MHRLSAVVKVNFKIGSYLSGICTDNMSFTDQKNPYKNTQV